MGGGIVPAAPVGLSFLPQNKTVSMNLPGLFRGVTKLAFVLALFAFGMRPVKAATTIGPESLIPLPADAAWQHFLNFLPANGATVSLNPPQFQWLYNTNKLTRDSDFVPKTFIFQAAYDPEFGNIAVNVTTLCNFYNTLAPFTNSPVYWRVGYVLGITNKPTDNPLAPLVAAPMPTNAVYMWSSTRSFTIAPDAKLWDRSYMGSESYLASKNEHPYIGFNKSNRQAFLNFLNTSEANRFTSANRMEINAGKSWRDLKLYANSIITNSWWPATIPTNISQGAWSQSIYTVAFMWALTRDQVWSNAHPEIALQLVATNFITNKLGNYLQDYISSSISTTGSRALALGYDWCYDLMTPEQKTNVLYSMSLRCRYMLMGFQAFYDSASPYRYGLGDPSQGYTNSVVERGSLFLEGDSHATDNFHFTMLPALAGYGENPWCRQFFDMGVNYMLGPTYCYRNRMGNGRPYTLVHMGSDRMLVTQMLYKIAFPEVQFEKNPFFSESGDWWDLMEPVGYQGSKEPWGDTGFGDLESWEYGMLGRNLAVFTGSPRYYTHWRNQELIWIGKNHSATTDDAFTISIPYYFDANTPFQNTTNTSRVFASSGWSFAMSGSPSLAEGFTNGVGLIFQARPCGSEMGHSHLSDGSFEMWAYGASVTDASGTDEKGSMAGYGHLPIAQQSLLVDGRGIMYPNAGADVPYYCRFLAFTNSTDFTYIAADLTGAYPKKGLGKYSTGWLMDNSYSAFFVNNSLASITNVTRQLLFARKKYLVTYDTIQSIDGGHTFSWLWQVRPPNLQLDVTTMSFTYSPTNYVTGNEVKVYVKHIGDPAKITVLNMAGTDPDFNYRVNPITGENFWTNTAPHWNGTTFYEGNYGDLHPRSNTLWFNNKLPSSNFHFMTVIYPVPPGGAAPTINRLDDYTAEVINGAEHDVISFDPNTQFPATLIVNAIGSVKRGPRPPPNTRIVAP